MIAPVSTRNLSDTFATAQEGMRRSLAQVGRSAEALSQGDLDPGNIVGLLQGQRLYEVNAKVLRTGDQMLGTLLNVFA
jgi:flagellar hook protein FlgE